MLKINHSFKHLESIKYDSVSVDDVNKSFGMPVVKQVNRDGRLQTEVVFELTPIEKMHEGLTVDDFALENLLANGYQPHRLSVDNQTLDTLDKGIENIGKAASAVKSARIKLSSIKDHESDHENENVNVESQNV